MRNTWAKEKRFLTRSQFFRLDIARKQVPMSDHSASEVYALLGLLTLAVAAGAGLYCFVPPRVVPSSAPPSEFSAKRAMKHLDVIAREPHPTGSLANAHARNYLVDQLNSLGLKPEVQKAVAMTSWDIGGAPYGAGVAENILARASGANSTGALLLMAHYDSVATGPGAADDGSGVVTLLETVRALRSSAPLRNDVIVLFTEGEKDGGLGAQAFTDEHPWAKDVALIINPDSGGSCGPANMAIFHQHNGWLVREFTKALAHSLAASIGEELSRMGGGFAWGDHLPLYRKGVPVLGLSVDGCQTAFETVQDKTVNLDPRSVQDLGEYEIGLVRHFGNLDLKDAVAQDDVIFFPIFGHTFFYSVRWVTSLGLATLLALLVIIAFGLKQKILTAGRLALAFLFWAVGAIAVAGVIALLWRVLLSLHLVNGSYLSAYNAQSYTAAFVALAAAIASGLYAAFRRKVGADNLIAGALVFCGAVLLLTYLFIPRASYLLVWPLLFPLLPLGCALVLNRQDSLPLRIAQIACAVPAIALFVPLIAFMEISPGDLSQTVVIIGVLTMVLFALLAPQLEVFSLHKRALFPGLCAVVALALLAFGASRSGYDARHPKPDSMSYWLDAQAGKASWISFDEKPDDWTSQFLTSHSQADHLSIFGDLGGTAILRAPAPALSLAAPAITTLDDSTVGDERSLRLQISSPRQARVLWVIVGNAAVLRARLEGGNARVEEMDRRNKLWGFIFVGLPPQGITLDVTVQASESPQLIVTDQSDGLPEVPGFSARPRNPDRMPFPHVWPFFDSTALVSRTFIIPAAK